MEGRKEVAAQITEAEADLAAAGQEWLEVRARGGDTAKADAACKEAERTHRRLQRRLKRIDKKTNRAIQK